MLQPRSKATVGIWIGLAIWIAVLASGLVMARRWAFANLTSTSAQSAWTTWQSKTRDDWRAGRLPGDDSPSDDAAVPQPAPGPVARRPALSDEPPMLVLLRDYFFVCMSGAIGFGTLLYLVAAYLFRGALTTPLATQPESNR